MTPPPVDSMPVVLRSADAGGPPAPRRPREGAVLRGGAATAATALLGAVLFLALSPLLRS